MTTIRNRAWMMLAGLAAAACLSGNAASQDDAVERCRQEATDAARIACLEAALSGVAAPAPETVAAEPEAPVAPVVAPAPAEPIAPAIDAPANAPAPAPAVEPDLAGTEPEAVVAPPAPAAPVVEAPIVEAPAAPPTPTAEAAPSADEIGAEQVRSRLPSFRREPPPRVQGTVVAHSIYGRNQLQVELENGQVWRQLQGDVQRFQPREDSQIAVEIWRAGLGGYRMRFTDYRRILQVQRIH